VASALEDVSSRAPPDVADLKGADLPADGPFRIAVSAAVGSAFGGIMALSVDKISGYYSPQAPWYFLKLSQDGRYELASVILVTVIAVLLLEPLVEIIRWHDRRAGHVHASTTHRPRVLRWWLFKVALATAGLLLLNMSHEVVHEYAKKLVDLENLWKEGAVPVQLGAAVIIIFGTTWAWAFSARFRLATVLGGAVALCLGGGTYYLYHSYLAHHPETNTNPSISMAFGDTPPNNPVQEVKRAPKQGIVENKNLPPETDKAATDNAKTLNEADKLSPVTDRGVVEAKPVLSQAKTGPPSQPGSASGIPTDIFSLNIVFYAIGGWVLMGLIGGIAIDVRLSSSPSIVLASVLFGVTFVCDLAGQLLLQHWFAMNIYWPRTLFWFGLGAGWAAGIFVLGPSADMILATRKMDVPALLCGKLSGWWRRKAS
jgi:hypothetical protein